MKKYIILLIIISTMLSCQQNTPQPKEQETAQTVTEQVAESVLPDTTVTNKTDTTIVITPFGSLKKLVIDQRHPIVTYYKPDISTVINDSIEIDGFETTRVIKTRINSSSTHNYIITYDDFPSGDPAFTFYKTSNDTLIRIERIPGTELYIPGNNQLYVSGHTNNLFDQKKKYVLNDDQITEVEQPYNYVGIESSLETDIILYQDFSLETELARLTKGTTVSVLAAKENNFLIKTPFGLLGWIKIESNLYPGTPIKEIYFAGD